MWNEFKKFIMRGNVIDLAVGVIVGAAFNKIVTSLVNDVIMPPIGLLVGKVDFKDLYINLSGKSYSNFEAAKADSAPTINIGVFINNVLDFLIVAFVIFIVIRQLNRFKKKEDAPSDDRKDCPYCRSKVDKLAVRCPHCTSHLTEVPLNSH
ncbi:large-conductance mechanosensitive channel protein MscL [Paenibacillus chartarius]|uniref:Large-conductance mechanosensitive channel n=1 Tax=Paenibacillus chartarius TaxID=747481 RepID=A0ABV6DEW5_9BACL